MSYVNEWMCRKCRIAKYNEWACKPEIIRNLTNDDSEEEAGRWEKREVKRRLSVNDIIIRKMHIIILKNYCHIIHSSSFNFIVVSFVAYAVASVNILLLLVLHSTIFLILQHIEYWLKPFLMLHILRFFNFYCKQHKWRRRRKCTEM